MHSLWSWRRWFCVPMPTLFSEEAQRSDICACTFPLFYWIIPNTKVAMDISKCHHCQGALAEDANYPSGHNFHSLGRHGRHAILYHLSSPPSVVEGKYRPYQHRFQPNRHPSQRFWGSIGSHAWVLRNWEVSRVIFRRLLFCPKYSPFFFRWTQFLIIMSSHSDPTTGDIHTGPNNVASVPVIDVSFFSV